jgi:hypothetical protein
VGRDAVHCGVGGHFGLGQLVLHHELVGQAGTRAAIGLVELRQEEAIWPNGAHTARGT